MITNTLFVGLFCQVQHYLGGGEGAMDGSIIDRFITAPISNNLDVFSQFVFAVCGMMGLLGGLRIYNMAMNGEDEVKRHALQSIASTQQPMQADSNVRDFMEKQ